MNKVTWETNVQRAYAGRKNNGLFRKREASRAKAQRIESQRSSWGGGKSFLGLPGNLEL